MRSLTSWSGGKDSCYALMQAIDAGIKPAVLLNVMNETGRRSRSHGLPATILEAQATQAGIPLRTVSSSWSDYENNFVRSLQELKQEYQLTHAVFGDIDLQAHRDWEEKVCDRAGLIPVLPLWLRPRKQLALEMLQAGIQTLIVSCNEVMGQRFLGRYLTSELLDELESLGVDSCGENGEFHTLVTDCPLFKKSLETEITDTETHEGYWFAAIRLKVKDKG
ncbi:MAG: diphthine--ammonia ligase [Sphingobacteriales bacterium]|nr:diphthine--ammonia ligase [Sphingobacteriales bacterium]OJW34301.1 MAG: adenosine nucleotide hydrolase [Sphingobacteriales bacterium 46-32]